MNVKGKSVNAFKKLRKRTKNTRILFNIKTPLNTLF